MVFFLIFIKKFRFNTIFTRFFLLKASRCTYAHIDAARAYREINFSIFFSNLLCFLFQVKILEIYLITIPRTYEKSENLRIIVPNGKLKALQQQQMYQQDFF
jgi:hypothetical protein